MQNHSSFTVRSSGGTLRALQTPCSIAEAFDPNTTPQPHPPYHPFHAIWDTGATNSVITQQVVTAVSLQPIGMTLVQGVHSTEMSEVYLVNVGLLNGVGVPQVRVTKGILSPGVDVLIGMDIITIGDFAITNRGGITVFSFCAPTQRCLDFVQEYNDAQKQNRPGFRGFTPRPPTQVGRKRKNRH
jgi:hypothetical protein